MRRLIALAILFVLTAQAQATPMIDIVGSVDGSATMQINNSSVAWTNTYYDTPTDLTVNGTSWDPSVNPSIDVRASTT